jgi:hypothetical protein
MAAFVLLADQLRLGNERCDKLARMSCHLDLRSLSSLGLLSLSILSCAEVRAQKHEDANALAVQVQVDEELNSATAKLGQEVHMHVSQHVMKDGKEVIAEGAPVQAHLTRVKQPGHGDRDGQIKLTMVSVQAVNGNSIALHKGNVRRGSRLIALFAGPCSVPFPLTMLMVGEDVKIPKGQSLIAYIQTSDLP